MTVDTETKEILRELLKRHEPVQVQQPVTVKHDIFDMLSKIGVALCTAAIIYVASQLQGLTTDVAVMKTQMTSFQEFTEAPRFTMEHNKAADQLLLSEIKQMLTEIQREIKDNSNSIDNNKRELLRRTDFMNDTDRDVRDLQDRLRNLESEKTMLKKQFDDILENERGKK